MVRKVLITGGSGFIGSSLVKHLRNMREMEPAVYDLKSPSVPNVRYFEGNILDHQRVHEVMNMHEPDVVFHLAGPGSVARSVEQPLDTVDQLVKGTVSVLESSFQNNVDKFVQVSTCHTYGDSGPKPSVETQQYYPDSPYGASKSAAEDFCHVYYRYGLNTVILKFGVAYGPNMPGHMLFDDIVEGCQSDGPIELRGTGENSRDFTHIQDIVKGSILSIEKSGIQGEKFNISSGAKVSVRDAAQAIKTHLAPDKDIVFKGERWRGDTRHIHGDITKARAVLGYEPEYSFEKGIKEFVERRAD